MIYKVKIRVKMIPLICMQLVFGFFIMFLVYMYILPVIQYDLPWVIHEQYAPLEKEWALWRSAFQRGWACAYNGSVEWMQEWAELWSTSIIESTNKLILLSGNQWEGRELQTETYFFQVLILNSSLRLYFRL